MGEIARRKRQKLQKYYPDQGPLRRELYVKHLEFFEAGSGKRERLMLAANRIGKTEGVGGYECVLHATGRYPKWWKGRRFDRPTKVWVAGDTSKTVREILQEKLLGKWGEFGTGLIPGEDLIRWGSKAGVQDAVDTIYIRHYDITGRCDGESVISLKSYDQRRQAFQGTEQDVIWLDEEPPLDVYTECVIRTMTTRGLILCTFTPMLGMSQTVMHFLPTGSLDEISPGKYVVNATWDDAPHLSTEDKAELLAGLPPHMRDARSKGVPQLGSGAIYPIPESEVKIDDFAIPEHWKKWYGFDVGWNATGAAFFAMNPDTKEKFIYSVYKQGKAEPSIHASAISSRGDWIRGAIDPASKGRAQRDGIQLLQVYSDLGLELIVADNAVEAGLYQVWQELAAGTLKVFASCLPWFEEFRMYRRDDNGKVVKQHDHLMDCTRYGVMTDDIARYKPVHWANSGRRQSVKNESLSWLSMS